MSDRDYIDLDRASKMYGLASNEEITQEKLLFELSNSGHVSIYAYAKNILLLTDVNTYSSFPRDRDFFCYEKRLQPPYQQYHCESSLKFPCYKHLLPLCEYDMKACDLYYFGESVYRCNLSLIEEPISYLHFKLFYYSGYMEIPKDDGGGDFLHGYKKNKAKVQGVSEVLLEDKGRCFVADVEYYIDYLGLKGVGANCKFIEFEAEGKLFSFMPVSKPTPISVNFLFVSKDQFNVWVDLLNPNGRYNSEKKEKIDYFDSLSSRKQHQVTLIKNVISDKDYLDADNRNPENTVKQNIHAVCHLRAPSLIKEKYVSFNHPWSDATKCGFVPKNLRNQRKHK